MGSNAIAVRTPYTVPHKVSFSLTFFMLISLLLPNLYLTSRNTFSNPLYTFFFTNSFTGDLLYIAPYSGWSASLNLAVMRSEDICVFTGQRKQLMAATTENELKTVCRPIIPACRLLLSVQHNAN